MHQRYRILHLLADGRFCSGQTLGAELGLGRGAVWRIVKSLREMGQAARQYAGSLTRERQISQIVRLAGLEA